MPLTRFPNGLTVNSTSALAYSTIATDGDIDCNRLYTAGAISAVGRIITETTAGIVGQYAATTFTFGTSSGVLTGYLATPFAGRIEAFRVITMATASLSAAYTLRVGSAGAVAVATVTNTTNVVGGQETLAVTATTFAITNALVCTRSVQGTAGETQVCVITRLSA